MRQLLILLMMEGISFHMENDGITITIRMTKGIFHAHQIVSIHHVESMYYPEQALRKVIDDCHLALRKEIDGIKRHQNYTQQNGI